MNFRNAIPPVLALAVTACSAPMVTPDGPSMQSRIGYVKDWDALAETTAAHFASECECDKRVVFIAPGPSDMPFAAAYRKLLEEKLQRHGVVSETASPIGGAGDPVVPVVLRFDVQAFVYGHDGRELPAVWVPVGEVLDSLASLYDTTRAEVLLTVTASNGEILLYRDSTKFYIHPSELAFYRTRVPDFSPQLKSAESSVVSLPVRAGGH